MNETNYNHKIEFLIWPLIPILFFILYLFKLNEIKLGQAIVCVTILFIVLLTLYYYLYQSQSTLLRILLGLSSAVIIGNVLGLFHVKGATLILLIGTVTETVAGPILIGLILKRYETEVREIRVLLISILTIQVLSIAYSTLAPHLGIDFKALTLFADLTLVLLTATIALRDKFPGMNRFIQASIKSILLLQLTTVCIRVVLT